MLQHRYEFNPLKRYVFVRIPQDATFNCTIEISTSPSEDGIISKTKEFPCSYIKTSDFVSVVLMGVENTGCLEQKNLGSNFFRFRYRIDDVDKDTSACIFVPLNNYVRFSFVYGTETKFGLGVGSEDVQLVYQFDKKTILSSWISSPWSTTLSIEPISNKIRGVLNTIMQSSTLLLKED